MDAGCCFCCWLLRSLLIIFLHPYLEVLGAARECPQGQLLQVHKGPRFVTCCYPTWCGVGHQVAPCIRNGTQDTCEVCGPLYNQSVRTSSFTMERCSEWPLDKDCNNINNPDRPRDDKSEQTKRCMCNIELGMLFYPPENKGPGAPMDSYCQRSNDLCKPGFEPKVDGGCSPCKDNRFKSTDSFNLCQPKTICTLLGLEYTFISNATADNMCSEPEPVVTTKSSHLDKLITVVPVPETPPMVSSVPPTTVTATTTTEHLHHTNTSLGFVRKPNNESNIMWPVIGTMLGLLFVLASIGLVIICRYKRLSFSVCGKNLRDPEKNTQGQHIIKHCNGAVHSHHMVNGGKFVNNNGNAAFDTANLSNGHANGNIPHEHLNHVEHRSDSLEQYTNNAQHQPVIVRPGILRTSSRNGVFGHRQENMPDMISDLGPEKLCVNLVPNSNLGEGDCLLVSGYGRGASYDDIQNWPISVGNSPLPVQTGAGPVLALNGCGRAHFGLIDSNPFLPTVPANGETVVYSPAADMVIFTRSGSVITSPVDDVGEDAEARFPRFSQLLQDGDDVITESAETSFETCVLNPPIQLKEQSTKPQAQHHFAPSAGFDPPVEGRLQTRQPDHYIMNLKEQDLVDSEHSSFLSSSSNTELKTVEKDLRVPSIAVTEDSQLTEPKALCRGSDITVDAPVSTNVKTSKLSEQKQSNAVVMSPNMGENKKYVIAGGNVQTFNEKKSAQSDKDLMNSSEVVTPPNGGSNQSGPDRHCVGDSSELKSCVKNSSSKESVSDKEKPGHYNRMVSFENNAETGNKYVDSRVHSRQLPCTQNSTDKVNLGSVNLGAVRYVSDTEQSNTAERSSAIDGTEWRSVHQKNTVSGSPMKVSENGDVSSSDESCSSPHNSVIYRRSQSHNTCSSSESAHKPPPRSMSEDKQHKTDRPIAKVKPMPASDSCVNQLQTEGSVDVQAATPNPGVNTHFNTSSDDAGQDPQHDMEERYSLTSGLEDGDRERAEEEVQENRV